MKTKKRVLVVDDQIEILNFIRINLRVAGYDVITARSGEEALLLVRSDKPDIMLLDMLMPSMSGLEVLEKLREFSDIPVIIFSALNMPEDEVLKHGADDFISKPFKINDLKAKIKGLIDRR